MWMWTITHIAGYHWSRFLQHRPAPLQLIQWYRARYKWSTQLVTVYCYAVLRWRCRGAVQSPWGWLVRFFLRSWPCGLTGRFFYTVIYCRLRPSGSPAGHDYSSRRHGCCGAIYMLYSAEITVEDLAFRFQRSLSLTIITHPKMLQIMLWFVKPIL